MAKSWPCLRGELRVCRIAGGVHTLKEARVQSFGVQVAAVRHDSKGHSAA